LTRQRLRDLYIPGWREYMAHVRQGMVAFAAVDGEQWTGPAVDLDEARATPAPLPFADHLDEVPVMLVLLADLSALAVLDNGLGRQSIVGGASVYPFAHNVLLAARNEGLGGVLATVLCREEAAVKELLHVPAGVVVAGVIALGRPAREVTRLRRTPVEEFATVDRFDGLGFTVS
jgi:nitroreductase